MVEENLSQQQTLENNTENTTEKKVENPKEKELDAEFIESVEKSKLEIDDKVNFLLTKGGLKPASVMELPIKLQTQEEIKEFFKEDEIDDIINLVKKSGLEYHIGEKMVVEGTYGTKDGQRKSSRGEKIEIFIAQSKENLASLVKSWGTEDQEAIGKALGFPPTAVEAFVGKRENWFREDVSKEIRESESITFLTPVLSRDNWREEIKEGEKRAEFIKRNSPEIYATIVKAESQHREEVQEKNDQEKIKHIMEQINSMNANMDTNHDSEIVADFSDAQISELDAKEIVRNLPNDNNVQIIHGTYWDVSISEKFNYVLKTMREMEDPLENEKQKQSIFNYPKIKEVVGSEFFPKQIIIKSKLTGEMQILQEKQDLQKKEVLKIETVNNLIGNAQESKFKEIFAKKENRDKLERFLFGVEKLIEKHSLILDLLGDNLFVGNDEKGEFDIKLVDYGCFKIDKQNKWADDINAVSQFIEKIRKFLGDIK